jgi:MFS family permease
MSKDLLRLGLISFVFNLGGGVIAPALPLYARSLGADYRDLGLIGAAHGIAFAGLTIPLGRASDRFGRRTLLLASALAMGLATVGYLTASGVPGLVVGKLIEAVAWAAFWPALEAWVAESFGRRAGTAMGVGYGAYAAAFFVGTSAAGFIIEDAGLRAPFAVYLSTAIASLALLFAVPIHPAAPAPEAAPRSDARRPGPGSIAWEAGAARRQRFLAYGTGFVYVFGLGTILSFLPAYAADRGLSPRAVGLLLGSYWAARLVAAFGAGRLSDRWGRRAILLPAILASALGAALIGLGFGIPTLFIGAVALGLTSGACAPACIGLIADHVTPADRGIAMGLFEGACGVSFILSGVVGGITADAFGPEIPYLVVAAVAAAWTPVLARYLARQPVGAVLRV